MGRIWFVIPNDLVRSVNCIHTEYLHIVIIIKITQNIEEHWAEASYETDETAQFYRGRHAIKFWHGLPFTETDVIEMLFWIGLFHLYPIQFFDD